MKQTEGTETSQYLEEKKSTEIPPVAASEQGAAQSNHQYQYQEKGLERLAIKGDSPVSEGISYCELEEQGGTRVILSEDGGTILQG